MRIAIVGDRNEVRGFALAGVEPIVCEDEASVAQTLERLEEDRHLAVIVITAQTARLAPRQVAHLQERVTPPVPCLLPGGGQPPREGDSHPNGPEGIATEMAPTMAREGP
jgi:vacuolar-type H+-ATPase subunit F/Vma7